MPYPPPSSKARIFQQASNPLIMGMSRSRIITSYYLYLALSNAINPFSASSITKLPAYARIRPIICSQKGSSLAKRVLQILRLGTGFWLNRYPSYCSARANEIVILFLIGECDAAIYLMETISYKSLLAMPIQRDKY